LNGDSRTDLTYSQDAFLWGSQRLTGSFPLPQLGSFTGFFEGRNCDRFAPRQELTGADELVAALFTVVDGAALDRKRVALAANLKMKDLQSGVDGGRLWLATVLG
jgi:hypothetical protein